LRKERKATVAAGVRLWIVARCAALVEKRAKTGAVGCVKRSSEGPRMMRRKAARGREAGEVELTVGTGRLVFGDRC
jgi:hypothetical protein